jgi:D-3-phosphoglycerate dehydrogenase
VHEKEPPERNSVLQNIAGVILTPHLSWYSEEAGWRIREKIVEDVTRYLDGRPPRYPVNSVARESHAT